MLEPESRIELLYVAYEATILPLNYSGIGAGGGNRTHTFCLQDRSSTIKLRQRIGDPGAGSLYFPGVAAQERFERPWLLHLNSFQDCALMSSWVLCRMAAAVGIEPTLQESKSCAFPFGHAAVLGIMVVPLGLEPRSSDYKSDALTG